jgi:hypothetical protein
MKIAKIIAAIMMMATVATCFAGCGKTEEASSTIEYGEIQTEVETESATTQEQTSTTTDKTHAKAPSDYEFPASPEVIVYQGDKEVFHYAGETPSEVKSMLKDMGIKDEGRYRVIKEGERLTVEVYSDDITISVGKLLDDMRMVVDGMEINLDTMNAIAPDGFITTDLSTFKPDDFKTKQWARLQIITNSNTGNIVGCDVCIIQTSAHLSLMISRQSSGRGCRL